MHLPENQIHQLQPGAGLINPEIIPPHPHPHPSFCSSSYYNAPLSDVVCDRRDGIPEDRTLAALRKHKESEKQRRTRINSQLDKLRADSSIAIPRSYMMLISLSLPLLSCLLFLFCLHFQIDKATLLAMVVQRMRELKRQTSDITALGIFPSESDQISILSCDDCYTKEHLRGDQELVFKASLCCEDRSDLLPNVIEVLNSLHLKVQKAELSTIIGGRIRNVLFVAANKDQRVESIQFLQNSLKPLLERAQQ